MLGKANGVKRASNKELPICRLKFLILSMLKFLLHSFFMCLSGGSSEFDLFIVIACVQSTRDLVMAGLKIFAVASFINEKPELII